MADQSWAFKPAGERRAHAKYSVPWRT